VDELAKRLDSYPNFAVDLAARVCHLQVQQREKVREFCVKYQDRILYATDFGISEGSDMEGKIRSLENEWQSDWNYFATGEDMESSSTDAPFVGLDLDRKVLKKIFYSNAIHWYPGIFQ